MPRHHHVRRKQQETAPTRIVVAVRRAVTAADSDGTVEDCHRVSSIYPARRHRLVSMISARKAASGRNWPARVRPAP
jgi:hypothetical protein